MKPRTTKEVGPSLIFKVVLLTRFKNICGDGHLVFNLVTHFSKGNCLMMQPHTKNGGVRLVYFSNDHVHSFHGWLASYTIGWLASYTISNSSILLRDKGQFD